MKCENVLCENVLKVEIDKNVDKVKKVEKVKNVEIVDEVLSVMTKIQLAESFSLSDFIEKIVERKFQLKVAKPRMKKSLKRILDMGPQNPGSPYTKKRQKKSNALVAKEASGMGGGAIAFGAVPSDEVEPGKRDKKKNDILCGCRNIWNALSL